MSIFARLQFDSTFQGGNVTPMSNNVIRHMDNMPPMLNEWQTQDVATANVGGYYENPVSTVLTNIWTVANNILSITGLATSNISQISNAATVLYTSANNFMGHTNRMSGVSSYDPNDPSLPTYQSAIGAGKLLSYIVYQSDGVQNNAPMIGSFTSLYSSSNLSSYYSTIQNYPTTVQANINIFIDPETGLTVNSITMSQSTANNIAANLTATATFMDTRRTTDVTFYTNSQSIISDYNSVRGFSSMGQTENSMVNNLIGSDKLLERINP